MQITFSPNRILFDVSFSSQEDFISEFFRAELSCVVEQASLVPKLTSLLEPCFLNPELAHISNRLAFSICILFPALFLDLGLARYRATFAYSLVLMGFDEQATMLYDVRSPSHLAQLTALLQLRDRLRGG